jgi:hypothetical protein
VHAIEDGPRPNARGVEPAAKRRVLPLERSDPLANAWRLGLVGCAIDVMQALLGSERAATIAGELFAKRVNQALQLPECLVVRSCVL